MPRAVNKKGVKAQTSNVPSTHALPAPFQPVTGEVLSFTDTLPENHIYIVHVETTPPGLRKQAFLVPVILNLIILSGLCWRLYYAVPAYLEQMITILGHETRWTVKPNALSWNDLGNILFYRTFLLSMDYVIFGFGGRWPLEFVFGDKYGRYAGPCGWKKYVGFSRSKEAVVRRGRKWDNPIYEKQVDRKKQSKPEKSWTKDEELAVYSKCSDALRKDITSKNALSLLDKDWDLDYQAMIDATVLLEKKSMSYKDIDQVVLAPWQGRWYCWYPHGLEVGSEERSVTEKDEKLEGFKKRLAEIGCEDVFYRWIELIQYETSRPNAFTEERKKAVVQEFRKMLRSRSKDDEAFIALIGGPSELPGLR